MNTLNPVSTKAHRARWGGYRWKDEQLQVLKADYEARTEPLRVLAAKHKTSMPHICHLARSLGWKARQGFHDQPTRSSNNHTKAKLLLRKKALKDKVQAIQRELYVIERRIAAINIRGSNASAAEGEAAGEG